MDKKLKSAIEDWLQRNGDYAEGLKLWKQIPGRKATQYRFFKAKSTGKHYRKLRVTLENEVKKFRDAKQKSEQKSKQKSQKQDTQDTTNLSGWPAPIKEKIIRKGELYNQFDKLHKELMNAGTDNTTSAMQKRANMIAELKHIRETIKFLSREIDKYEETGHYEDNTDDFAEIDRKTTEEKRYMLTKLQKKRSYQQKAQKESTRAKAEHTKKLIDYIQKSLA
ncbi:MAG: hypothetical protein K9J21_11890 [Bacteroidales bacterium]|nr:hypothetical protein [Bacteroidales bacterium]